MIIGFLGQILMVGLLLLDKASPQIAFILISNVVSFWLVGMKSLNYFGLNLGINKALEL
ncbi:MAG: hypothetical protein K2P17_00350 [Helicobacteraceae bacterium]|nr:hypothetical protein [Helicobacteraceae bacterium]